MRFQGTLEGAELEVVLQAGLTTLFQNGALPFIMMDRDNLAHVALPIVDTEQ